MTSLEVECLSDDNGRSYFRAQSVRLGTHRIATPTKSLEPNRLLGPTVFDPQDFAILEAYRTMDPATISGCQSSAQNLEDVASTVRRQVQRAPANALRFCFVSYEPGQARTWPSKPDVELLTDIAYSNSDIVPIPLLNREVSASEVPKFLAYVERAFAAIERSNNKPIAGLVPTKFPRAALPKLLKWYAERGIDCLCVDFGGTTPDPLKTRPIIAELASSGRLQGSVLYSINARAGKFMKNAAAIPARDFFSYGYGFDILGGSHRQIPIPMARGPGQRRAANSRRLFLAKTYGYHRVVPNASAPDGFPPDSQVSFGQVVADQTKRLERLFNMEQHLQEAARLSKRLQQLGRGESVLDYVKRKTFAASDVQGFRRGATLM